MNRFLVLAIILWGACGFRALLDRSAARIQLVPLRIPFSEFPMDAVGPGWEGEDVPLEEAVREQAGVSAYLQRHYRWNHRSFWLYVGYISGPALNAVHHPGVCFPASGVVPESERDVEIAVPGLATAPRFREYLWYLQDGGSAYTLTTFHYQGKFEPAEEWLRAARAFGLGHFAIITLTWAVTDSLEETRGLSEDVIRRALPRLLRHLPAEGPDEPQD